MDYNKLAELLFPNVRDTVEDMEKRFPARDLPEGACVTRFAPSPTGFVHFGNFFPVITSERLSHQSGGKFILRIEDTDAKREIPGCVENIITTLASFDIHFDEGETVDGGVGDYGPYRQSKRGDIYAVFAKKLVADGVAYPCFCTEEDLSKMREVQEKSKENTGYYGKYAVCRNLTLDEIEEKIKNGEKYVIRVKAMPTGNRVKFRDLIKGELEFPENDVDHVLLKSDGIPTYHFAHAVDDHLMRVTHVIRGDEWLATLPLHVQLFKLLGHKLPKYLHISPLMKNDNGSKRKLSKRKDPEVGLSFYDELGYTSECVREYVLTLLNSSYEEWRRANPDAPYTEYKFKASNMSASGALFDIQKLDDISKTVFSKMTGREALNAALNYTKKHDTEFYNVLSRDLDYSLKVMTLGREVPKPRRDLAHLSELKSQVGFFFDEYFTVTEEIKNRDIVYEYAKMYDDADDRTQWFDRVKTLASKFGYCTDMKEYKKNPEGYIGSVADVSNMIRIALTGKSQSPDLYDVMHILGKEKAISRLMK